MKQFKNLVLPIVAIVAFMTSCQTVPVTEGDYDSYPAYKGDDLEMTVSDSETNFTLWSPTADSAVVRIYNEGIGGEVIEARYMDRKNSNEPWRVAFDKPLYGKFYTFSIFHNGFFPHQTYP